MTSKVAVNLLAFQGRPKGRPKIGGVWVKRADSVKIGTKNRNFLARDFGKIGLKIGGGGVSRSIFCLVNIANLLLMPFLLL